MPIETAKTNETLLQARKAAYEAQNAANEADGWPRSATSSRPIIDTKPRTFGLDWDDDEVIEADLLHIWSELHKTAKTKWRALWSLAA